MKKKFSTALLGVALIFSGCGESTDIRFPIVDPPLAVNDGPYTLDQDTTLSVAAINGVLVNDITNGGTASDFDRVSAQGATVNLAPDGAFNYTPVAGFSGPDSFTYTVSNGIGDSTATVSIQVDAVAVNGYFVDSVNGSDSTGSFDGGQPYASIQQAVLDAPGGADIVVRPGNYSGSVTLKADQRLLGSGSTLVNAQGDTRPVLTGPVVLNDGNTLDFLRIQGTAGPAVDGAGQESGEITNCEFANTTVQGAGVGVTGGRGTWTIDNNVFTGLSGNAIFFSVTGGDSSTVSVRNNSMTGNALAGLAVGSQGTSNVRAQVHGNRFSGNNTQQGKAFELEVRDNSTFCLDLEDNINDGVYSLFVNPFGSGVLNVEQLNALTTPKPSGAGNTGSVDDNTGIGGNPPTPVADGFCGF